MKGDEQSVCALLKMVLLPHGALRVPKLFKRNANRDKSGRMWEHYHVVTGREALLQSVILVWSTALV